MYWERNQMNWYLSIFTNIAPRFCGMERCLTKHHHFSLWFYQKVAVFLFPPFNKRFQTVAQRPFFTIPRRLRRGCRWKIPVIPRRSAGRGVSGSAVQFCKRRLLVRHDLIRLAKGLTLKQAGSEFDKSPVQEILKGEAPRSEVTLKVRQ